MAQPTPEPGLTERELSILESWWRHPDAGSAGSDVRALVAAVRAARERIAALEGPVVETDDELRADRDRYKAALEAIRVSPKAVIEWLEAVHPDVARRLTRDDLGTGTGDIIRAGAAAALAAPGASGQHPEATCQRCGGPNISWVTPSALWNGVVGSPNGILCPVCFARAAAEINIDPTWRFEPAPTTVTETWAPGAGGQATEE